MPGKVNVDFKDVQTVLKNAGKALMGAGEASGTDRALKAIEQALSSPLLESHDIRNARRVLFTMAYSRASEITMREQSVITDFIKEKIGGVVPIAKSGDIFDDTLDGTLRITIVAAGFDGETKTHVLKIEPPIIEPEPEPPTKPEPPKDEDVPPPPPPPPIEDKPYVYQDENRPSRIELMKVNTKISAETEEIPTFQRYNVPLVALQDVKEELLRHSLAY